MRLLKIDIIKKHIEAYDYTAALSVAKEIREEIPEDAYRLIEIAVARVKLNRNKINRLTQNKTYDIFPIKEGNKQKMFEYALVLQIKLHKEEYADFIRGITPIVVDLLEAILDKQCGIRISDYCTEKDGMKKWDSRKLENSEILTLLNEEYNGESRFGPVYSNALAKLIERKCTDATVIKKVGEITKAESMVRNVAAHEIVSVTDEWFQKKAGKSAQDIFADLRYLIGKAGINATAEQWRSYEHMNHMIKERLEENM
jgi:hypothetical protein